MRSLLVLVLLAACGGPPKQSTLPVQKTSVAPAHDLAAAKATPPPVGDSSSHLVAKDPRIVDLDIIRITASQRGIGGEPQMDHVATADLFRQATDAAKGGETERAITLDRQIVTEFP